MKPNNNSSRFGFFRNDMRRQIVTAMILIAVLPMTVLSVGLYYFNIIPLILSYVTFNKNMLDQQLISEQIVITRKYTDKLNMFFRDLEVQASVLSGIADGNTLSIENQQQMIRRYMQKFPHILWMSSVSGLQLGQTTPGMQQVFEMALSDEIILRPIGDHSMKMSSPFHVDDYSGEKLIVVSIPAYETDSDRNLFLVSLPPVEYLVRSEAFDGSILVVDEKGRMIIQSNDLGYTPGSAFSDIPIVRDFLVSGITEKAYNYRGLDNYLHRGVLCRVDFVNWGLITQRKPVNLWGVMLEMESTASNLMNRLILAAIVGLVSVGLLAGSVGALIALRFTKPLQNILEGIDIVAQGDFSYRFKSNGSEDIRHLIRTLNGMIDSIQSHTQQLNKNTENIREMFLGSVSSLVAAIDAKDPYTRGHSRRVQSISVAIGRKMGLTIDQLQELEISALMHDIGKLGIKEELLKKPGVLTTEERSVLESHPTLGAEIMRHIPMFRNMLPGLLHHHERWNGSGYPKGLVGKDIPIYGRIIAVADTFDAMTSERPYQDRVTPEQALDLIRDWSGIRYDPVVVQAFSEVFSTIKGQ